MLLVTLVAGFTTCHIHPVYSYKLHRYQGQYLYLKSAEMGLRCVVLAFLACVLYALVQQKIDIATSISLPQTLFDLLIGLGLVRPGVSPDVTWVTTLSALTLFAPYLIKAWAHLELIARYGQGPHKVHVIASILEDSPLDDLLFQLSLDRGKYAMLTISDRKVYVGKIIALGEPSETDGMDQDISIMPLMSGYREPETLEIKFTTDYDDVDQTIYLAIRQEAILSVTEFSFDAYAAWNPPATDSPKAESGV